MTTKKRSTPTPPPPSESDYLSPGAAAQALAAQIEAASGGSEDEPVERLVIRIPLNLLRGVEKLAAQAIRSRNHMAVQLLLAGFDGVLAALPAEKRDEILLATMVEETE
jgi:hypothetical protein